LSKKKKATSGKKKDWIKKLVKDVWPQERDFMERPERYRYVRKLLPASTCVFCETAAAGVGAESLMLVRDRDVMIVMNKYPYNTGHLLILPLEHKGRLWDLSDDVSARLAWWIRRAGEILTEELGCQGLNIGLNHGAVAGAGIPDHLHWHVVPRWSGDTNFFPLIAETKVLPQTLQQTYNRLQPKFAKLVKA
jgi:ATP adenylyltransferase